MTEEHKSAVLSWVDNDCLLTLKELVFRLQEHSEYQCLLLVLTDVCVNFTTRSKVLMLFQLLNCTSTIEQHFDYAQKYRQLEQEYLAEAFIFAGEVGFKISTRPKRGRSDFGTRATTPAPFSRSCNISVVAVINKEGMICFKIHNQAVTATDFQVCLGEIEIKCNSKGIDNPVLVLDYARIHRARNLLWGGFTVFYLPPYCPFLTLTLPQCLFCQSI